MITTHSAYIMEKIMSLQNIYNKSPYFIQVLALNLYAGKLHLKRYNKEFKDLFSKLMITQYFNRKQIIEYQNIQLKSLVRHAYDTVPYYRELFNKNGIKVSDINTVDDLHKIPILTKNDVLTYKDSLISTKFGIDKLSKGVTSGTTGSPLEVYWDNTACIYNNVVDWRQKKWSGINYKDKIALILGRTIVPVDKKNPPFWVQDYFHNQLWMSAFHLSKYNLESYVKKLISYKAKAIEGYPSTLYAIGQFMLDAGITLQMKAVFTSSETLYDVQREVIEKAFKAKVTDFYGLAERAVFATECQHGKKHINFEYGICEIVNENNNIVSDGEEGYVVGTSLVNYGMPLIRYKTTDISSLAQNIKCACGREMPILSDIKTKAEDMIIRKDGTKISASVLTHPFKPIKNIEKSQIIQEDYNNIIVNIVRKNDYSESDSELLVNGLAERLGSEIKINIVFVEDISRTRNGKYRWVISKIGNQFSK